MKKYIFIVSVMLLSLSIYTSNAMMPDAIRCGDRDRLIRALRQGEDPNKDFGHNRMLNKLYY